MEQDDSPPRRKRFLTHPKVQKIPAKTRRRMQQSIAESGNSQRSASSDAADPPDRTSIFGRGHSRSGQDADTPESDGSYHSNVSGDSSNGRMGDEPENSESNGSYHSNRSGDSNNNQGMGDEPENPDSAISYRSNSDSDDDQGGTGVGSGNSEASCSSSGDVDNEEAPAQQYERVYHPLRERQVVEGVEPGDVPTSSDEEEGSAEDFVQNRNADSSTNSSNDGLENDERVRFPKLLQLLQGHYSERITVNVTATRGELLEMALAHRHQNRLTNKAFIDSVNLVNSAFASSVIPDTFHLLDNLLSDDSVIGIQRYFFCKKCHKDFGQLDHTGVGSITCTNQKCKANNVVGNLTEARYIVLFDIVSQLQLLLEEDENHLKLVSPKDCIKDDGDDTLNDIVDGLMYQMFAKSLNANDDCIVITFILNTDGAPVFKSSRISIWPIFLIINELPPLVRMRHVLLGGLWFGKEAPSMDLFLQKFVSRFSSLSNGFLLSLNGVVKRVKAYIIAASVDSGARGAVQGVKSHGGYCSCNWCEIVGVWSTVAVKYPAERPKPRMRTHNSLRVHAMKALNRDYPRGLRDEREKAMVLKGAIGLCSLDGLQKFDTVQGFIVEYMHAVLLGVVRRMLCVWKDTVINADDLVKVDSNIKQGLSPPVELRRRLRPIEEWKDWKARDFENFLLSFSVPLLHDVLPRRNMNHFTLLIQAIYFLLKRTLKENEIALADKLLEVYVTGVEEIYGVEEMTFNVHLLTHIARNCALWGGLWANSTYPFEHMIGKLKETIHSVGGISHQVCRNLSEQHAMKLLKNTCSSAKTKAYISKLKKEPVQKGTTVGSCHYFGVASRFVPTHSEAWLCEQKEIATTNCFVYEKVIKDKCLYLSARRKNTDNTVAITMDNQIVVVQKFILHDMRDGYVFVKKVVCRPFFQFPRDIVIPLEDHCVKKVSMVVDELLLIPIISLKSICCRSKLDSGDFVSLVPNLFNVF